MSLTFNLWFLKANSVSNNSAVNIGMNLLIGWSSNNKESNGIGALAGDGAHMSSWAACVDDRDWFDMPTFGDQGGGAEAGVTNSGSVGATPTAAATGAWVTPETATAPWGPWPQGY